MRFRVEGREIKQQDTMIGVQGDNQVETYEFDLPRVYNGIDLYGSGIAYIIFQPCGGEPGYVPINEQDRKLEGDRMILTWIVGNQVTQSEGFLKVALKISGLDAELWNSLPTRFIIGGTIQVDSPQPAVFAKSSLMLRTANPDMEPPITVTERKINIPAELQNIAVQNDENSEEVKIILPRFFDGNDLSQYTISLICKSDGGKSIVTFSPEVKSSEIHLLWMLKPPQTSYAGKLNLQLRVEGNSADGSHFLWQTEGDSSVNILKELGGEPVIPVTPEIYDQFLTNASQLVQEAKGYSESASSSASSALSSKNSANTSANSAAASAQSAAQSATAAQNSESAAENSASDAQASATNAANSANEAEASAGEAMISATNAKNYAIQAELYKNDAATSAQEAKTAAEMFEQVILVSDWNDAIKPGFYYSANNAANAPTFEGAAGGTGLYGLVFCCGKQVRQVVMPGFGSGCKVRFCNAYDSNTWYMWQDPLPLANASMSINGLMSYADKAKLDNTYTKEDSRQTFANAFVGEKSGTVVSLPDVAESTLLRKVAVQGATTEVLANPDAEKSPDNIATINGTEPTALTMCGKNLLPYKYESDTQTNLGITATRNPDGSITIQGMNDGTAPSSIYLARNNLGLHLPAGTYTLSAGTLPRGIDLYITPGYKFGTFTLQEAADFTIAYFNISLNTDLSAGITVYPQLEVGSTATSYEPYSGTDYPLPALEPLMSLPNGVRDEYDAVTGVETRRIGKLALNGTENWNILSGQCNETSSFFYLVFPMGGGIVDCTHLICRTIVSGSETYTYDGIYGNAVGSTLYIRLNHSHNITTAEGLKEWLAAQHAAGTPVTVYYELAEPVITQHTPTAIPAVYPTTTVYSDQGDISVTYNCDSNQIYGELVDGLEGKVDKETGKGLSANDYTTAEKQKLAGIAQNANNYTHPTTSGNKHIPSGGEEKQILRFDSDGTAKWDNEIDAYPKEEIDHKMDAVNAMMVQILIKCYGVKEAMRRFVSAYADGGEDLSPIVGQFFEAAASTIGETYTSQFPKYSAGTSTEGIKLDDNAGLVCTPSTIAAAGQDDYAYLPLFACFDVNYTIDGTSLEPVILAIKDIYGGFTKAPANSFVGVMQMTGWVRRTSTDTTKKVEYRATEETGFKPLPEAVRVDGTVRGFVIHAKYAAGFNSAWLLSSVSGVQPASLRTGSAGSTSISHNGQIAKWREWGDQYCGSSLCDIAFVQLMLEIKYAVLGSAQIMTGCRSYSASYQAAVAETGVTRILLTAANAAYFIVGSCVSLGSTNDRAKATTYDVCDITKILSIEDVTVDGTAYKAVNLDTETPFNTTVETYITPQPWQTGSTDDVLGNDGSPYSNTNSKEPCKIQGIEIMLGLYEVLADVSLNQDTEKYTVYANRKASEIASDGSGANPAILGTITKDATANWDYVAELNWDENSPESYMLGKTFGASPSTGYRAGVYRDGVSTTGWREWMVAGYLNYGSISGFACAHLINDPSYSYWNISARACGSGGNRGEANHTV